MAVRPRSFQRSRTAPARVSNNIPAVYRVAEEIAQVQRVAQGVAEGVVVEVDVRVAGPAKQVARERPQRPLSIAAAILPGGSVEPEIAEAAGEARRRQRDQIVLAEGGSVRLEHRADFIHVPARAAELERMAKTSSRQLLEELREAFGVGLVHLRRKLPEDHRQLPSQPQDEVEIPLDAGAGVLEALHVREIAAPFCRETKARWRTRAPTVHRRSRREA